MADNFHSVTGAPGLSVFVKFYTTWCSHCKAVETIWQEVGQYFLSQAEDVVIAQIDMTANYLENVQVRLSHQSSVISRPSVIPTFQVAGFPSFRLYKSSGEELEFTGPRDLENFIKFVKTENENVRKEEL